jgi:hypothetical protein
MKPCLSLALYLLSLSPRARVVTFFELLCFFFNYQRLRLSIFDMGMIFFEGGEGVQKLAQGKLRTFGEKFVRTG